MASRRRQRQPAPQHVDAPPDTANLPNELLQRILHAGGRATRRVCRHWRATYGPLRGLLLTDPTSRRDLLALPPHLSSIRALALAASSLPPPPSSRRPPNPRSILTTLPRIFPCLASLDLDIALLSTGARHAPENPLAPYLQSLALLHPHLTTLTLRHMVLPAQPLTPLPAALPALRSLTLSYHGCTGQPINSTATIVHSLTTLRALSQLQHLALCRRHAISECLPTAAILPHLVALPPTLTHLDFQLCHLRPDHTPQDLRLLHAALPSLRTLRLPLDLSQPHGPPAGPHPALNSSLDTLAAALSQRQALTGIHLDLSFLTPPSHSAVAHLACLHSRLRSLNLRLDYYYDVDAAVVLERLAPSVLATPSLTSLTLATKKCSNATLELLQPLAALWGGLAPTLHQLNWAHGTLAPPVVTGLAQLTALQALRLPVHFDVSGEWEAAGIHQAVEALLSLTRLVRLVACSRTNFASSLLAGIGRLPALRQLMVTPASDAQARSGLASASSTLTRLELHCRSCSGSTAILRAVGAVPPGVRCLGLLDVRNDLGAMLAHALQQQHGHRLVPLPHGLRVLALGGATLRALSGQVPAALEAASRRQDCVLVSELPRYEHHFGCNGYL